MMLLLLVNAAATTAAAAAAAAAAAQARREDNERDQAAAVAATQLGTSLQISCVAQLWLVLLEPQMTIRSWNYTHMYTYTYILT